MALHVVANSSNQIAFGLRFDSENAAAALFNISIDCFKLSGVKFDFTTHLSINPWAEARVSYAWAGNPQANFAVRYWESDVNRFYDSNSYTLRYNFYGGDMYISDLLSRDYDLCMGVRYDYFSIHNLMRNEGFDYSYIDTESSESYTALYALLNNDKYDKTYFPTRGFAYGIDVSYNIKNKSFKGSSFGAIQATLSTVALLSNNTFLLPALYTRHLSGKSIPLIYSNARGGYLPQRYMRQQYPFVGFVGSEFMENHLTISRVELRQRFFDDIYASGIINYAYSSNVLFPIADSQDENINISSVWGVALQLAYDTTIGPIMLCAHWNDLYHQFGFYFSLGFEL